MINPFDYFAHENDYADLDLEAAYVRLSKAIQCKTVYRTPETTDFQPFEDLKQHLLLSYPTVMDAAQVLQVNHSLLIILDGRDPDLDAVLFLAHQDVVPEGDAGHWTYPPFSGHIDDEWIWGRGALDIKDMLIGELEAAEYLLLTHGSPRRRLIFAFGEDEEVLSTGAKALAAQLKSLGLRGIYALDEGVTTFTDAEAYGAAGTVISDIGLSQKGFLNVSVGATGTSGHSSNPFGKTSLERLCVALAELSAHPLPPVLTSPVQEGFSALKDLIKEEPLASLVQYLPDTSDELAQYAAGRRELFPLVANTMSINQISGSSPATNMMPGDVSALINFRLLPGTTDTDILRWMRSVITDEDISIQAQHVTPAGRMDSCDTVAYRELAEALAYFYPAARVIPSIVCGGTDSIHYQDVCETLLRICPFRPAPEELKRGMHGYDERISKRVFAQGVRVIIRVLEHTAW